MGSGEGGAARAGGRTSRALCQPPLLALLTALLGGCEITVPCTGGQEVAVPVPGGTFSPAVAHLRTKVLGAPFFSTTFPRGAADHTLAISVVVPDDRPAYDASAYMVAGEAVPSAVLYVDPNARVVVRSYVNAEGRAIEERWRTSVALFTEAVSASPSAACRDDHQVSEHMKLELLSVTADRVAMTDLSAYRGYDVSLEGELPPGRLDRRTTYVHFAAHRALADSFGREQSESLGEFYPVY